MTRHCLDLFSGLGGFSAAFEDSPNWTVTTIDNNPEFDPDIHADVMELHKTSLVERDYEIILASPPCKVFTIARGWEHWDEQQDRRPRLLPADDRQPHHIALVYQALYLINTIRPDYWFLENPRGFLRRLIGPPMGTVHYCQYGSKFMKPTDLWGNHPLGFTYKSCSPGSDCHIDSPRGFGSMRDHVRDPAERAKVPYGLSKAILEAVESPPVRQVELIADGAGRTLDAERRRGDNFHDG